MIYKNGSAFVNKYSVGDNVWAIYVDRCGGKSGRMHNKAPMFGKLIGYSETSTQFSYFAPYKVKRGKLTDELDTKKKIWVGKLMFSDTYEEAAEEYNRLIQEEIDFHENKVESLKKCLITLEKQEDAE